MEEKNKVAELQIVINKLNEYIALLKTQDFSNKEKLNNIESDIEELEDKLAYFNERKNYQDNYDNLKKIHCWNVIKIIVTLLLDIGICCFIGWLVSVLINYPIFYHIQTYLSAFMSAVCVVTFLIVNRDRIVFLLEEKSLLRKAKETPILTEEIDELNLKLDNKRKDANNVKIDLRINEDKLRESNRELQGLEYNLAKALTETFLDIDYNEYLNKDLATDMENIGISRERIRKELGDSY